MKSFRQLHRPLGDARLWIGGWHDDLDNQWKWIGPDGRFPITIFDWAIGEPNRSTQDCLILFSIEFGPGKMYKWDDDDCGDRFDFICEKVNPQTITTATFILSISTILSLDAASICRVHILFHLSLLMYNG